MREWILIWKSSIWILIICGFGINGLFAQTDTESSAGVRVAWDYSSLQQLALRGGYPRVVGLKSGKLIAVYENYQGDIHLKSSMDAGKSWSDPQNVFQSFQVSGESAGKRVKVAMSNPEIIELTDGRLLLACNYRPQSNGVAPFSIAVRVSDDAGHSWSKPKVLFEGGKDFKDGCWEPSFLQLPWGEVQLYFANESPYRQSDEQEISVFKSLDNGQSWQGPTMVSFRAGKRDGMPVAALGGEHIYLAIEDNKIGEFKPYIIHNSVADNWKKPVRGNDLDRWYALDSLQADSIYMGAPYLLRLPAGEYLLSYQTNKNRSKDWEKSTMEVRIGDRQARGFRRPTRPFPIPYKGEGKWNSLTLLPNGKVAALSSAKFDQEQTAPWMIEGYLLPEQINLMSRQDSAFLFVGSVSKNRLQAWVKRVDEKIKIRAKLIPESSSEFRSAQGFYLYFSNQGEEDKPLRVHVEKQKKIRWEVFDGDRWEQQQGRADVEVTWESNSEELHLAIPVEQGKELRIGLSLSYQNGDTKVKEETLVHMDPRDPKTWILLKF